MNMIKLLMTFFNEMKKLSILTVVTMLVFAATGCSNDEAGHSHGEDGDHTHGEASHSESAKEMHNNEHDEEAAQTSFAKQDTLTKTSRGVRLMLHFDEATGTFTGSVDNTTEEALCGIAVQASSENGTKFGATEPTDLQAGQSTNVTIEADNTNFTHWMAKTTMKPCGDTHTHDDGSSHGDH